MKSKQLLLLSDIEPFQVSDGMILYLGIRISRVRVGKDTEIKVFQDRHDPTLYHSLIYIGDDDLNLSSIVEEINRAGLAEIDKLLCDGINYLGPILN